MKYELVHRTAVAEAYLDLGRMHVHIHQCRFEVKLQYVRRVTITMQHVLIGGTHCVGEQLVADKAAIHVKILRIRARAGSGRQANEALQAQRPRGFLQWQSCRAEFVAENLRTALFKAAFLPVFGGLAVVRDGEAYIRSRQCNTAHHFDAVTIFRLLGLEEFATGGRVEIQVLYIDRGAFGPGSGAGCVRIMALYLPGMGGVRGAGGQCQLRDRGNRGQRLAAEPKRGDVLKVMQTGDLGRRVTRQRQRHLFWRNTAAVVDDRDSLHAAGFQSYRQLSSTGIEGVFQQLLDNRRWSFDDLAGSDLGDQLVGKLVDGTRRARLLVHFAIIPSELEVIPQGRPSSLRV